MVAFLNTNSKLFVFIMAVAIIVKKFYMMSNYDNNDLMQNLISKLNDKEKEIYKKIKLERFEIYSKGSLYGLIAFVIYLFITRGQQNYMSNILIAIIIWSMTTYLYYTLSKKSDYMIRYLDTQEEREAWLEIYKTMKNNCHGGFVLGVVIAGLIAFLIKFSI
tara:strand:+ start:2628 stop:3113 length:486 start_codon:yes stop_codon:yes gene_type:complete